MYNGTTTKDLLSTTTMHVPCWFELAEHIVVCIAQCVNGHFCSFATHIVSCPSPPSFKEEKLPK